MHIKNEDLKKLQKIYKEQLGKEMSEKEASEAGQKLLMLFKALLKNQN